MVSKLAAEHVKVVLTGDGGDEIFAGYDKYVVEGRERAYDRVPAALRGWRARSARRCPRACAGAGSSATSRSTVRERYLDASTLFRTDEMQQAASGQTRSRRSRGSTRGQSVCRICSGGRDWMSAVQYCDLQTYLPLDVLTKVDRMTMAHSIEARPPLLDHRLVEFAARIPSRLPLREARPSTCSSRRCAACCPTRSSIGRSRGSRCRWRGGSAASCAGFARDILLSDTCRQRGVLRRRLRGAAAAAEPARPRSRSAVCGRCCRSSSGAAASSIVTQTAAQSRVPATICRSAARRPRCTRPRWRSSPRASTSSAARVCRPSTGRRAARRRLRRHVHCRSIRDFRSGSAGCGGCRTARTVAEPGAVPAGPARGLRPSTSCTCSPPRTGRSCSRRCRRCWPRALFGQAGRAALSQRRSGRSLADWGLLVHPWLRLADEIVVPSDVPARRLCAARLSRARDSRTSSI